MALLPPRVLVAVPHGDTGNEGRSPTSVFSVMGLLEPADYADQYELYRKLCLHHVNAPIAASVASAAAAAATDGPNAAVAAAFAAAHATIHQSGPGTRAQPRAPPGLLSFVKKHGRAMLVIGLVAFIGYKVCERGLEAKRSGGEGGLNLFVLSARRHLIA